MRIKRILLLTLLLPTLTFGADPENPKRPKRIALAKPALSTALRKQYCSKLFAKDWALATGEITEAIPKNGYAVGVGSRMKMTVDGDKVAEGVFLGRIQSSEFQTTDYMFMDYAGKRNYIVDAKRCEIEMGGRKVPNQELQAISTTFVQQGETCATSAILNFFTQLLAAGREGNGLLRKELQSPEGFVKLYELANEYYVATRGGSNFETIFKKLGKLYGYACKSLELVQPKYLENTVNKVMSNGLPVLLEFYIGSEMVKTDRQWINANLGVGEDKRFWAPRAVGQREGGGHSLVAVEAFESPSGRKNLLIKDSDWEKRPINWDYEKYFAKRIKSSGMLAHHCDDLK